MRRKEPLSYRGRLTAACSFPFRTLQHTGPPQPVLSPLTSRHLSFSLPNPASNPLRNATLLGYVLLYCGAR